MPHEQTAYPLRDAIAQFILDRKSLRRRPATIRYYQSNLQRFAAFLDETATVADLTRANLRAFFAHLADRDVSEATHAAYDRALRTFTKFCILESWLDQDPFEGRPRVKAARDIPDTLELAEIRALIATCAGDPPGVRDRAMMLLLLDTGMRAGEICAFIPSWLTRNGDRGTIRIPSPQSKSARGRTVMFSVETLRALNAWLAIVPPSPGQPIFTALSGHRQPIPGQALTTSGLNQMMRRHADRAGIHGKDRWCHIWRHTFARMYVVRGGDLETLRRLLGHASLETVRIYLEFRTQDLEDKHHQLSPVRTLFGSMEDSQSRSS